MLNKNIKQLRINKGWSQEELAQSIYTSRQTISKWENGISVPDANTLIKIAETFNISVAGLLGEEIKEEMNIEKISEKLEALNIILAQKENRSKSIWQTIGKIMLYLLAGFVVLMFLILILFVGIKFD